MPAPDPASPPTATLRDRLAPHIHSAVRFDVTVTVLVAHQRLDITDCICARVELGRSHARHVANALADSLEW